MATIGPVSISHGTPPAPQTAGSFGWRITATLTLNGNIELPVYLDILGFVDGPAEVALVTSGLSEPFPAAPEQRLFSLLLERAGGGTLRKLADWGLQTQGDDNRLKALRNVPR